MGRPSKAEARDTRREILDAALELMAQHGFGGTSMRQIARAVGVRESALYHHFPSKEAILGELIAHTGPEKAARLAELDLTKLKPEAVAPLLEKLAGSVFEEWSTPREMKMARLMITEAPRLAILGRLDPSAFIDRGLRQLEVFFARLIEAGLIREGDPSTYAIEFLGPLMMMRMRFLVLQQGPVDARKLRARVTAHARHFFSSVEMNRTFTRGGRR